MATYSRPSYTNWGGAMPRPRQPQNTLATALSGTAGTPQNDPYGAQREPVNYNWGGGGNMPSPRPTQPLPASFAGTPERQSPLVNALSPPRTDHDVADTVPQAPPPLPGWPGTADPSNMMNLNGPEINRPQQQQPTAPARTTLPPQTVMVNPQEMATPTVAEFMKATGANLEQAKAALSAAPGTPTNWQAYMPNWTYDPLGDQKATAAIGNLADYNPGTFTPNAAGAVAGTKIVPMFTQDELAPGMMNQFKTVTPQGQLWGNIDLSQLPYGPNMKSALEQQALQYGVGPDQLNTLAKQFGFSDWNSVSDADIIRLQGGMGRNTPLQSTVPGAAGVTMQPNPTQSQWEAQFGPQSSGNALMDSWNAANPAQAPVPVSMPSQLTPQTAPWLPIAYPYSTATDINLNGGQLPMTTYGAMSSGQYQPPSWQYYTSLSKNPQPV